jgi:hypothetical protein
MRNFLSTSDIAQLSGYSRAQVLNWWRAGLIPARNANAGGKQLRFIDSSALRLWCELKRKGTDYWILEVIKTVIECIVLRDRGADAIPRSDVLAEMLRELVDSKNPKQLLLDWARALADGRFGNLPHVS